MNFCDAFNTIDEASNNYPKDSICDKCIYNTMDNGIITCKKIQDYVMNNYKQKGDGQNESR